jgi:hypothetical protein
VFNEAFREMARTGGPVELSYAKESIQDAARELDVQNLVVNSTLTEASHRRQATKPESVGEPNPTSAQPE